MKNLMKLFSIFLVVSLVAVIVTSSIVSFDNTPEIVTKLSDLLMLNVIPVIIISICCLCMQRKDEGFFIRIILAYMLFFIVLSAVITFLPLSDISQTFNNVVINIYNFILQTQLYLLAYALLSVVKPNNVICNTIKKIAYIALLANIVVQLWVIIKEEMIETLPNVYGYQGFNFSSLKETAEVAYKVVFVSLYVEVMAIILTYITNYAFEQDVIEAENLDYDELKKQADSVAKYQIENIYSPKPEEVLPDRSVSEKTGLMNISNQLGADSTVGQVSGSSNLSSSFVDKSIPVSSGPIINSNLTSNSSLSSNYPSQDNSNVVNNQKPEEPQQNKFLN